MKRCPECRKDYLDDSLLYCLDDGAPLVQGTVTDEPATAILSVDSLRGEAPTQTLKGGDTGNKPTAVKTRFSRIDWPGKLPWIAAVVCALIAAVFGYAYFGKTSLKEKAVKLSFNPPAELSFNDVQPYAAVISPDGQTIAFSATADGKNMLYIRGLDSTEAKVLPGSENPLEPFWSPDSRSIAYGSNGKLKRSDLSGGNPQVICDAARLISGSWSKDGVIIFVPDYRVRIMQVSAKGGEPQAINIQSENIENERNGNAIFMPDGRHYLFRRQIEDPNAAGGLRRMGIWAGTLDSTEVKQVTPDEGNLVYTPEGWLVFIRNDSLVAQAFDATRLQVSGEPITIISGQPNATGPSRFSVSDNGVLIWQGLWQREYQLTWFDREGKQTGVVGAPAKVFTGQDPHISPDAKRLLVKRSSPQQTLWVIDLEKGTEIRITSDFGQIPVWAPDGSKIAFSSNGGLSIKAANGLGEAETVLAAGATFPHSWSPDGRFIIFLRRGVKTRMDMYALPMFGERKESLLLNSAFDEQTPQFSPDGKWLAYAADDTGRYEIYVQSFSADGKLGADRKLISGTGGFMPVWRRDGGELYFIAADGQMMVSSVKTGGSEFEFSSPKALFKTKMLGLFGSTHEFDVSPDGQRFLIGTLVGEPTAQPPTVVLNWTALVKK